jgi:hypothetical protein
MRYDPRKHHRRSIRLKGYDYTLNTSPPTRLAGNSTNSIPTRHPIDSTNGSPMSEER